ncbi:MAG: hypothetical protein RL095_1561 [Verrucomicrobiota bacterium]|jgi:fructokinase
MPTLHAFGELLIDALPGPPVDGQPSLVLHAGGAPANVACQYARLGGRGRVIGGISRDPLGQWLKQQATSFGVDCSGLVEVDNPTAMAIVSLTPAGERSFTFHRHGTADLALRLPQIDLDALKPGDMLHFCSNTLTEAGAAATTLALADAARDLDLLVSLDLNLRPGLWQGGKPDFKLVSQALTRSHLVKMAKEELEWYLAEGRIASAEALVDEQGIVLVVTDGPGEIKVYSPRFSPFSVVPPKVAAVDTTGAGDSFCGGLLWQLGRSGNPLQALEDAALLRQAVDFAARCGARTCQGRGAMAAMPGADALGIK